MRWSKCNSTDETKNVCVKEQCLSGINTPDGKKWSVAIDYDDLKIDEHHRVFDANQQFNWN